MFIKYFTFKQTDYLVCLKRRLSCLNTIMYSFGNQYNYTIVYSFGFFLFSVEQNLPSHHTSHSVVYMNNLKTVTNSLESRIVYPVWTFSNWSLLSEDIYQYL